MGGGRGSGWKAAAWQLPPQASAVGHGVSFLSLPSLNPSTGLPNPDSSQLMLPHPLKPTRTPAFFSFSLAHTGALAYLLCLWRPGHLLAPLL